MLKLAIQTMQNEYVQAQFSNHILGNDACSFLFCMQEKALHVLQPLPDMCL